MTLPKVCPKPCNDCPWVRTSLRGWLGPLDAFGWLDAAHSDEAIACHLTIKRTDEAGHGDWSNPEMRQCAGAAVFRANVHKSPRDPEVAVGERGTADVFADNDEFVLHHHFGTPAISCLECGTLTMLDDPDMLDTEVACPTCEDEGRDDPYCVEKLRIIPCRRGTFCNHEDHHHGDHTHHVEYVDGERRQFLKVS